MRDSLQLCVLTLTRTVRLAILAESPEPSQHARPSDATALDEPRVPAGHGARNAFASWPSMHTLGVFAEIDVTVKGEAAASGYLLDIKVIDQAVRRGALPVLQHEYRRAFTHPSGGHDLWLARIIATLRAGVAAHLPPTVLLETLAWRPHPRLGVEIIMKTSDNVHAHGHVLLRERFDFAAAHRLHVEGLTETDNRALFGKCNNRNGHGHNYQFEPCVRVDDPSRMSIAALEEVVERVLLARFDHTHLNEDTLEFDQKRGGRNPSVENIARVFFELLAPQLPALGGKLASMTVWETDRTSATYSSENA